SGVGSWMFTQRRPSPATSSMFGFSRSGGAGDASARERPSLRSLGFGRFAIGHARGSHRSVLPKTTTSPRTVPGAARPGSIACQTFATVSGGVRRTRRQRGVARLETEGSEDPGIWVDSRKVVDETVDGEVIIIHLERGNYFSLSGSGTEIWRLLRAGMSSDAIVRALAERFD